MYNIDRYCMSEWAVS